MKGQSHEIADFKGFCIWMLQNVLKVLVFLPGLYLSGKQVIKDKYLGGWLYTLGYGGDIWGNKFIAPHANKHWKTPSGYSYGKDEPISLPLAINLRDGTHLPKCHKWVKGIEKSDKGHMRKTLIAHGFEVGNIDKNVREVLNQKKPV
jgi:hypothetical protein